MLDLILVEINIDTFSNLQLRIKLYPIIPAFYYISTAMMGLFLHRDVSLMKRKHKIS